MAEPMSMPNFSKTVGAAHKRLNEIGAPEDERGTAYRLYPVLDRLYLRAEGEPDCADLVGQIDDICERAGVAQGNTADRVEALWERSELQAIRIASLQVALEAERAQLAAKAGRIEVPPLQYRPADFLSSAIEGMGDYVTSVSLVYAGVLYSATRMPEGDA